MYRRGGLCVLNSRVYAWERVIEAVDVEGRAYRSFSLFSWLLIRGITAVGGVKYDEF